MVRAIGKARVAVELLFMSVCVLGNPLTVGLRFRDVSRVTDMSCMFRSGFGGTICGDVSVTSNVPAIGRFNEDISNWEMGQVTTMAAMFHQASAFNQPIGSWNTSKVESMTHMFAFVDDFNQPLAAWDVGKVQRFDQMFTYTDSFDQPLASWDVSSAATMSIMFGSARAFNQDLCPWGPKIPAGTTVGSQMFSGTLCPSSSAPVLSSNPRSPFCHVCT